MIVSVNYMAIMIITFRMERHLFITLLGGIIKSVWNYYYPMELK